MVYSKSRIVVRQIGEFPFGSICPAFIYTLNTIYNISITNKSFELRYVLSILNSKLIQYYWTKLFYDNKSTFPKIKKEPLESIPIKNIGLDNQASFVIIVDYLLYLKSHPLSTPEEQLLPVYFEQLIDGMVYELYFEAELKAAQVDVLAHLGELPPLSNFETDAAKRAMLQTVFTRLYDPRGEVRNRLTFMRNVQEIGIIEGRPS